MHDVNRSGANVLLPIVSWMIADGSAQPGSSVGTAALLTFEGIAIAFVLLFAYWCAQPGTPGSNRFGDAPFAADTTERSAPLPAIAADHGPVVPESPLDDAVAQVTQKAGTLWSKLLKEVRTDDVERAALQSGQRSLPLHVAPPVITLLGGALVLVSMFLPALADPDLHSSGLIRNNLMVESHPLFLFCTVASIVSAIRYWQVGSKLSAQIAIGAGALLLGFVMFDAETASLVNVYGTTLKATAGAGLWMAAIGSTVVAFGGLMMRFPHYSFGVIGPMIESGEKQSVYQTKTCPRCAETIKAGAVVCRFCNYDFPRDTASGR